jgi:DNA-binding transcriptional LysR family regulator
LPVISNFLEEYPESNACLLVRDRTIDLVEDHIDLGIRFAELPSSAVRNSEYAATRASSEKLLLRPLGLGRTQAIVPANPFACRPHATSGWPIMVDKARFPRKAIERGA